MILLKVLHVDEIIEAIILSPYYMTKDFIFYFTLFMTDTRSQKQLHFKESQGEISAMLSADDIHNSRGLELLFLNWRDDKL